MEYLPLVIVVAIAVWGLRRMMRKSAAPKLIPHIRGTGDYAFPVVGESFYQDAFISIFGAPTEDGYDEVCKAVLVVDDDNPHDPKAVSVFIEHQQVGNLSRADARAFRKQLTKQGFLPQYRSYVVDARVRGGWNRGSRDKGSFGVALDLPLA